MKHDEFLFDLYLISFGLLLAASQYENQFWHGMRLLVLQNGTASEQEQLQNGDGTDAIVMTSGWTVHAKIIAILLFSTTGILGSSCASAITKQFGALTMSLTSTARKSATLFLSFLLFPNLCSAKHLVGMGLFLAALTMKATSRHHKSPLKVGRVASNSMNKAVAVAPTSSDMSIDNESVAMLP